MESVQFKMCEACGKKPAVGTGIRPKKYCRQDYVEQLGGEFQQFTVIAPPPPEGPDGIACAKTGETIETGGTVWLDPVDTHIPALIWSQYIEPVEAPKAAPKAKTEA